MTAAEDKIATKQSIIVNQKKAGRHTMGPGLVLTVKDSGSKSWSVRYSLGDKQHEMGLGSADFVSQGDAQADANSARKQALDGIDPVEHRKAKLRDALAGTGEVKTFKWCAEQYIKFKAPSWAEADEDKPAPKKAVKLWVEVTDKAGVKRQVEIDEPRSAMDWRTTLERYVYPDFGAWPVQGVDTTVIVKTLGKIWHRIPPTAKKIQTRVQLILGWAKAHSYRTGDNPGTWVGLLDAILLPPGELHEKVPHPALDYNVAGEFVSDLRKHECVEALSLEFQLLTATRKQEARFCRWTELDLKEGVWVINVKRMKNKNKKAIKVKRFHRIPLSPRALEILQERSRHQVESNPYVFGSRRGRSAVGDATVIHFLDEEINAESKYVDPESGLPIVPHGFRSTFSTWTTEKTGYAKDIREAALAHQFEKGVEGDYQRGKLLEKRRALMNDWAQHCQPA